MPFNALLMPVNMKILLFEYINGGGMSRADHLPENLRAQGRRMLEAAAADFSALDRVKLFSTHDARLQPLSGCISTVVKKHDDILDTLRKLLKDVDFFLPIAPEDGGALEAICALGMEQPARMLNSPLQTVRLCASKYETSRRLQQAGVRVVPSYRRAEPANMKKSCLYAVKPDKSSGAEGLRRVQAGDDFKLSDDEIVQPWLEGRTGSLIVICRGGHAGLLSINKQVFKSNQEGWRLQSCIVNGFTPFLVEEFSQLAQKAVDAIPGLNGFIGIDFIHHQGHTTLLEINPRLTLSYIGLHQSLQFNPAALLLADKDETFSLCNSVNLQQARAVTINLAYNN